MVVAFAYSAFARGVGWDDMRRAVTKDLWNKPKQRKKTDKKKRRNRKLRATLPPSYHIHEFMTPVMRASPPHPINEI